MKKLTMLLLGILMSVMFVGCNSNTDYYDPSYRYAKYECNFVSKFGVPMEGHEWGFCEIQPVYTSMQTRAAGEEKHNDNEFVLPSIPDEHEIAVVTDVFKNAKDKESVSINLPYCWVVQVGETNNCHSFQPNGQQVLHWAPDNKNVTNGSYAWSNNNPSEHFLCNYGQGGSKKITEYRLLYIPEYEAYYVGFDATGNGEYTDLIEKFQFAYTKQAQRIMCEDLGTNTYSDFDFNDAVLDVDRIDREWVITAQAAGGTLPLYIEGKEIHEMFGVPADKMVNTGTASAPIYRYSIPATSNSTKDIKITVLGHDSKIYELSTDRAPQKICVPQSITWMSERVPIDTAYPNFKNWVTDGTRIW